MIFAFWAPLASLIGRSFAAAVGMNVPNAPQRQGPPPPPGFWTGVMGRLALRGGVVGSAARIGLAAKAQQHFGSLSQPVLGALAEDFVELGKSLWKLPEKIRAWGEQLVESQRHLSQYNGTVAMAYGQLEAERFRRDLATAKGVADSTKFLTEAKSASEAAWRKWDELKSNVANYVGGALQYVDAGIGAIFSGVGYVVDGAFTLADNILFDWPAALGQQIGMALPTGPVDPDKIAMSPHDRERIKREGITIEAILAERSQSMARVKRGEITMKQHFEEMERAEKEREKRWGIDTKQRAREEQRKEDAKNPVKPLKVEVVSPDLPPLNQLALHIANGEYAKRQLPPLGKLNEDPKRMGW